MAGLGLLVAGPALAQAYVETYSEPYLRGGVFRPEVGAGVFGYEGTANLGAFNAGMRSYVSRQYLLFWSGEGDGAFGAIAYEHPYHALFGVRGEGEAEGGMRLGRGFLRPYVSASAEANASALWQVGHPLNQGANTNNWGDFGGTQLDAQARLGAGVSLLDATHAMVLEAQLLGEGQSAEADAPGRGFFGVAVRARVDLANGAGLIGRGDISYAVAPSESDTALGLRQQVNQWTADLYLLRSFSRRIFLGLGLWLRRQETDLTYAGGLPYTTSGQLDARIWLLVGYSP